MESMRGLSKVPKGIKSAEYDFEWGLRVIRHEDMYRLVLPYVTLIAGKKQLVACKTLGITKSNISPKHFTIAAGIELIPSGEFIEPVQMDIEHILEAQEYTPHNLKQIWDAVSLV